MKKLFLRTVALMLSLFMIFALAACNTKEEPEDESSKPTSAAPPKPTVVGVWNANIDVLDMIDMKENKELAALLVLMGDTPLSFDITVDIKADGTAELTLDTKAAVVFLKELAAKIDEQNIDLSGVINGLKDKWGLSEDLQLPELEIPKEEVPELELPEMEIPSIDELLDSAIEEIKALDPETVEPFEATLKYAYEDGKLYFAAPDQEISKDTALIIELTIDTLTVKGIETEADLGQTIPDFELPEINIEFKNIS